jgi:hypothetical protein
LVGAVCLDVTDLEAGQWIAGPAIAGVGWGLAGLCPGSAFTALLRNRRALSRVATPVDSVRSRIAIVVAVFAIKPALRLTCQSVVGRCRMVNSI